MQNNEIIRQLIDKKIVTISPDKDFVYASGMHSPIYTDLRQTISFPKLRQAIAENLAALIKQEFPEVTVIGGVATAGIPHAAWVAQVMNLPMVYVRSKPKDHGQGRQIEGRLSMDDHIVLIDDLISTGGSVLSAVQAVKETAPTLTGSAQSLPTFCQTLTKTSRRPTPSLPRS